MRRITSLLLAGIALSMLAGCGSSTEFVPADPTLTYDAKPADAYIEVHKDDVIRPHVLVGVIHVNQDMSNTVGESSTYEVLIERLREKARQVGGDAVINVKPVQGADLEMSDTIRLRADVIRYLEHSTTISSR
jgi:hypothetical protein